MRNPLKRRAPFDWRTTARRDLWSESGLDRIPPPSQGVRGGSVASRSGERVTPENVVGLTAALAAIRLLAETVGQLDCVVVEEASEGRIFKPAPKHPMWPVLHQRANDFQPGNFHFWAHMMASLQGWPGAYLLKVFDGPGGGVGQLVPADPRIMDPELRKGSNELVLKSRAASGREYTSAQMIYVPSILLGNPFIGVSPITAQADALGSALSVEHFAHDYMRKGQIPPGYLSIPEHAGGGDAQKRKDLRESWRAQHEGEHNEIGILWGGVTFNKIGISAQDAQLIDARKFSVDDVARAFRVPPRKIGGTDPNPRRTLEEDNIDLLVFCVGPWLRRIEDALWADDDLFPDKTYRPRFLTDDLFRTNMQTTYESLRIGRQGGFLTINEARGKLGLSPVTGGDDESLQKTPVGGESNPVTKSGQDTQDSQDAGDGQDAEG